MFFIAVLALVFFWSWPCFACQTILSSDYHRLRSQFDGSPIFEANSDLRIAQGPPQSTPAPSTTPEDSSLPLSAQRPRPSLREDGITEKDSCEEDFAQCVKRNWRWLVLTTLGGTTAFLLHKFITAIVEGGPVLEYGLLFAGFIAVLGIVFLISLLKSKKTDIS